MIAEALSAGRNRKIGRNDVFSLAGTKRTREAQMALGVVLGVWRESFERRIGPPKFGHSGYECELSLLSEANSMLAETGKHLHLGPFSQECLRYLDHLAPIARVAIRSAREI